MKLFKQLPLHCTPTVFSWPHLLIKNLMQIVPSDVRSRSLLTNKFTMSTQLSGVGTMEFALDIIRQQMLHHGVAVNATTMSACDVSKACQEMLRDRGIPCVFADIMHYTSLNCKRFLLKKNYAARVSLSEACIAAPSAWCANHKTMCPLFGTDLAIGGSPVGYSTSCRLRHELPCVSWARWVALHDTPIAIRLAGPATTFSSNLLMQTHDVVRLPVSPHDVGHGRQARNDCVYEVFISRKRSICLTPIAPLYAKLKAAMQHIDSQPGSYLRASTAEVQRIKS
jgi:hypothetical protein